MEIDINSLYDRMPEEVQSTAQRWFYTLHPQRSWSQRRRPDTAHERFVDRFFDDEEEYQQYQQEFFDGIVPEAVGDAVESVSDEYDVYDAHRDESLKYYTLVRKFEPEVLVETGVYSGVSTTSILAALRENGHGKLYSIDNSEGLSDDESTAALAESDVDLHSTYTRARPSCGEARSHILPPGKSAGWIVPEVLYDQWDLLRGRSQELLPALMSELNEIDFFLHDSEHTTACMLFEFELAWTFLASEGLILSAHVDWNDAFETFVSERPCEYGDVSFHYLGYREYEDPVPCRTAYIQNSSERVQ